MVLGIDLGTAFSVAAYITENDEVKVINNAEGKNLTPSVVFFNGDETVVGEVAKGSALVNADNVIIAVKNEMGKDKTIKTHNGIEYNPEMISSRIILKLLQDAETYSGEKVEEVVITVPAYFNDAQRKATEDAAEIAGVKLAGLINEPTAAAISYIRNHNIENKNILIYDLGGGTFDATLLHVGSSDDIEVISTGGLSNTGGLFLDEKIADYVCYYIEEKSNIDLTDEEYTDEFHELLLKAEDTKKLLTQISVATLSMRVGSFKESIEITREWFESYKILGNIYVRTEGKIRQVLKEAGLEVEDVDIVLMSGGSSRIPFIERKLYEFMGKQPSREENPDEAVAIGAAFYGKILKDNNGEKRFVDVCSHSIGVVVNTKNGEEINEIIIPKNSKLPVQKERRFKTAVQNQQKLEIRITEGEFIELTDVRIIGSFEIDLPKDTPQYSPILVKIGLDDYQLINIKVILSDSGFEKTYKLKRKANMDEETIANVTGMLSTMEVI